MANVLGPLHHVTMISASPQQTVDFYAGTLGLRLVKRTVNFDSPGTYHLYFGDELGHPGTLLTFFPWPGAPRGRPGAGQVSAIALAVPPGGISFWQSRLRDAGVPVEPAVQRLGDQVLPFRDPDGLALELVESPADTRPAANGRRIAGERAIRGLHGVTLLEDAFEPTDELLTRVLGFRLAGQRPLRPVPLAGPAGEDGHRRRYIAAGGGPGSTLDVVRSAGAAAGVISAGSVHHIAWRTPDDAEQRAWRHRIDGLGYSVTPILDRLYFHSLYFREPGGVLFEIATDPPGFAVDEPPERLGQTLRLPPWLEALQDRLERELPPLRLPTATP